MTLPHADDFFLISTTQTTHQNLINSIHSQVSYMGMKLKPIKCRSFSLAGGRPKVVPFNIGGTPVASIRDEEQKFFNKVLFFHG